MTGPIFPVNRLDLRQLQAIYELHMAPTGVASGMEPEQELLTRKCGMRDDLRLKPLNVESGRERFAERENVYPPRSAAWRSNLTALSQRHNLLFVAYSHQIYVWEPAGPWQTLGAKPSMIITPVMKDPDAEGFINPDFPHAINNIMVDDLGRDEVLILVTDSGNVSGYHVEAVFSAIERASQDGPQRPIDGSNIEPFFTENVYASAWGLAIHKYARMIAVSANTGLITVFAFALVDPTKEADEDTDENLNFADGFNNYEQNWLDVQTQDEFLQFRRLMPDRYRSRNVRLTYSGHFTNIPCVSFLNCDLDPNGCWMVSTDIDNKLLLWKVWELQSPFQAVHLSDITAEPFPHTLRNDERGWSVLALDPRTFRPCRSYVEACGGCPTQRMKNGKTVLDLTSLSRRVPDASHLYSYFPPAVKGDATEELTLPDIFDTDCCISKEKNSSSDRESGDDSDTYSDSMSDSDDGDHDADKYADAPDDSRREHAFLAGLDRPEGGLRTVDAQVGSISERSMHVDESHTTQSAANSNGDSGDPSLETTGPVRGATMRTLAQGSMAAAEALQNALEEAFDELSGMESGPIESYSDDESFYFAQDHMDYIESDEDDSDDGSNVDHNPNAVLSGLNDLDHLPEPPTPTCSDFPILHFSQTDIRLFPSPYSLSPTVVCGNPLWQPFTHPILTIRACDRFNMVKYVPEHGIVVAATQKGRAAIIALTEAQNKGLAFKINWIVPLESQEKYGERPLIPLLGMAVGPVQGFELPPDVAYIPRRVVNEDDITFHYRFIDSQEGDSSNTESGPDDGVHDTASTNSKKNIHPSSISSDDKNATQTSEHSGPKPLTLPECHAMASRIYQPDEKWRGWNPSRRYRLLLTYADNTVMSYEFWYEWSEAVVGSDYDGDRDDFLYL
ncbi:hypothetical protein DTO166G4_1504 [Paecilomyces variotii]|nr:hypothetical protein DTO166G4_1504 [Paecilomyces variotii]KAJ9242616.1 hypothetical protein DTO166G5_371 [Paecilomyces variotii]KAJ9370794.1 hypothetical protein DTO282E5_4554 [Paecilomyces variotii]